MIPAAALAVVRAAIEDAPLAEILNRPGSTARRIVCALETEGWTITPTHAPTTSPPPQRR